MFFKMLILITTVTFKFRGKIGHGIIQKPENLDSLLQDRKY